MAAVHSYVEQNARAGAPLPPSISLSALVDAGYLKANDIAGFHGMEASVNLSTNDPRVIAWAKLSHGNEIIVFGDGSVQVVGSNRLREQLRKGDGTFAQ